MIVRFGCHQESLVGTDATVAFHDSLPESGQWNFASWKRPVVTERSVPLAGITPSPNLTLVQAEIPVTPDRRTKATLRITARELTLPSASPFSKSCSMRPI
jgi:hypothetical protein